MALPQFLQPCLASYDLSQLDTKRDRELIITEVLNKGDDQAIKWLGKTYTLTEIKEVVASPARGTWYKENLIYWKKILDVKIPRLKEELAYIHLDPRPDLYRKFFKI